MTSTQHWFKQTETTAENQQKPIESEPSMKAIFTTPRPSPQLSNQPSANKPSIKIKGAVEKTLSEAALQNSRLRFTQSSIVMGNRILKHNLSAMHQCAVNIGNDCNLTKDELKFMLDSNGDLGHDILSMDKFITQMREYSDGEPDKIEKNYALYRQTIINTLKGLQEDYNVYEAIKNDDNGPSDCGIGESEVGSDPSLTLPGEKQSKDTVPAIFHFED